MIWHADYDRAMSTETVTVGPQGRVVIPAALRAELGIEPGSSLVARVEGGRLIFESREAIIRRLQARFSKGAKGRSAVAELLAERRAEVRREQRK
jgi:AbrB family looped-hinge helix DNA binding protein